MPSLPQSTNTHIKHAQTCTHRENRSLILIKYEFIARKSYACRQSEFNKGRLQGTAE